MKVFNKLIILLAACCLMLATASTGRILAQPSSPSQTSSSANKNLKADDITKETTTGSAQNIADQVKSDDQVDHSDSSSQAIGNYTGATYFVKGSNLNESVAAPIINTIPVGQPGQFVVPVAVPGMVVDMNRSYYISPSDGSQHVSLNGIWQFYGSISAFVSDFNIQAAATPANQTAAIYYVYITDQGKLTPQNVTIQLNATKPTVPQLVSSLVNADGSSGDISKVKADFSALNTAKAGTYSVPLTYEDPITHVIRQATAQVTVLGAVDALKIATVPDITFPETKLTGGAQTINNAAVSGPISLQDFRGSDAGWHLNVSLSTFIDVATGQRLQGARLTLPTGSVSATGTDNGGAPTGNSVTLTADATGTAQTLLTASNGNGSGTWNYNFDQVSPSLDFPMGQYAGNYQASLTWTLMDAPA